MKMSVWFYLFFLHRLEDKGVGRKFSRGGANEKKRPKNSKKDQKIAPLCLFQRGRTTEKRPKNSKKDRKIAQFNLYLLNLYHVWKSRGGALPPAADAHEQGRRQKNFRGGVGQRKKDRKIALLSSFRRGVTKKKRPNNSTFKGVLNNKFRPFSFELKKKFDFWNKFWSRFQISVTSDTEDIWNCFFP